jgi:hypothetical protein
MVRILLSNTAVAEQSMVFGCLETNGAKKSDKTSEADNKTEIRFFVVFVKIFRCPHSIKGTKKLSLVEGSFIKKDFKLSHAFKKSLI